MHESLELTDPKVKVLTFKVSEKDRQEIIKFCEDRGWRLSAFLRVAVQSHMRRLEDEKAGSFITPKSV